MNSYSELPSDQVIVASPFGLSGSAQRIWRITQNLHGWAYAGVATLAVLAITIVWSLLIVLYASAPILLPFILIGRGSRKRKIMRLRHQEMMGAVTREYR
jgi:hypothetical protein